MKKVLVSCLLIVSVAVTLAGCNGSSSNDTSSDYKTIMAGDVAGEITVSCYDSQTCKAFLEHAAKLFEAKYPDTKVNVETVAAMPMGGSEQESQKVLQENEIKAQQQAKDDYISRINTELMSGKGADILAIDILPFYKYADSNQLEDLNHYMENDPAFNQSDYTENVMKATQYKNGQYIFPMDYSFNYFTYDSLLAVDFPTKDKMTFADVIKAVEADSKQTGKMIFGINENDLFELIYQQDYSSFVDIANKKANFSNGEFARMLETIKSYGDAGYLNEDNIAISRQETLYAKVNMVFNLTNQFTKNLGTTGVVMQMGGGSTENDEIAGMIASDNGEVSFTTMQSYAINSNSKNKRTAWEFVKFLAGEEMQASGLISLQAIPINNSAKEQIAAMNITGESIKRLAGGAGSDAAFEERMAKLDTTLTPERVDALEKYMNTLDSFTAMLNKYIVQDEKIDSMVMTQVKLFFTGEKTADEVANTLQSKVDLYLNE